MVINIAKSSVISWVSTSVVAHVPQDVTTHLMNHLSLHPTLRTCSSDTILRAIKEPTQENISCTSDTGKNYDFNTADTLNTLLLNCINVRFHQKDTLKRFFERFDQNDLTINRFRTNCGSCSEEIVLFAYWNACLYNLLLPWVSRNQTKHDCD